MWDRKKDRFYAHARRFIEAAKADARAKSHPAPQLVEVGPFDIPLEQHLGCIGLYFDTYKRTLRKEHPPEVIEQLKREAEYRRMGTLGRMARDLNDIRERVARFEDQATKETPDA